jgi:hypothetical protein
MASARSHHNPSVSPCNCRRGRLETCLFLQRDALVGKVSHERLPVHVVRLPHETCQIVCSEKLTMKSIVLNLAE